MFNVPLVSFAQWFCAITRLVKHPESPYGSAGKTLCTEYNLIRNWKVRLIALTILYLFNRLTYL